MKAKKKLRGNKKAKRNTKSNKNTRGGKGNLSPLEKVVNDVFRIKSARSDFFNIGLGSDLSEFQKNYNDSDFGKAHKLTLDDDFNVCRIAIMESQKQASRIQLKKLMRWLDQYLPATKKGQGNADTKPVPWEVLE